LIALGQRPRLEAAGFAEQHGPDGEGEKPRAQGEIAKQPLHQMRTFLHVRLNP